MNHFSEHFPKVFPAKSSTVQYIQYIRILKKNIYSMYYKMHLLRVYFGLSCDKK